MSTEKVVEFVPLLGFENYYEILNDYPFRIRRKKDHYVVKESIGNKGLGYIQVALNGYSYQKHRLIAKQFIPNDDPDKNQIDHINHDKTDYHLSNLRWVSSSENQRNKSSKNGMIYTYVNEIDEDSITVTDYGNHKFEEYYFDEKVNKFYFWNGIQFRELHIVENKRKCALYVNAIDTNNKPVKIYYSVFKKLYGIG